MTNVIITTPVKGLNKGVVSDSNFIEYPNNSAEEMVNLHTLPDGVVERRPGLHRDSTIDPYAFPGSAAGRDRTFYWEPSPGSRHVVSVGTLGIIKVDDTTLYPGAVTTVNSTIVVAVTYFTQTPAGTGPLVASTESVWFNNSEHNESDQLVTSNTLPTALSVDVAHYYDIAGVRYIRNSKVNYATPDGALPLSTIDATSSIQFAPSKNFLVITYPWSLPCVIWKTTGGKFLFDFIDVAYRRYEDLPDGIDMVTRPASAVVNANFETNLLNRGWDAADITAYKAATAKWPAKSMVPWKGKNATGVFTPAELNKIYFNTSSAPTGSIRYSIADDKRSSPAACAEANARIWFGGFTGSDLSQYVAYTQPVMATSFMGDSCSKCYAFNDPTAEYLNQPTALDGGMIKVEGAKNIHKLLGFADGVLVFASNGVWAITGFQGQVFQGNAFNIYKITDKGSITAGGVVEVENKVLYVTQDGINQIVPNDQTRSLKSESITDNVIGDLIKPMLAAYGNSYATTGVILFLRTSTGVMTAYDKVEDKVYFMFGQGTSTIVSSGTYDSFFFLYGRITPDNMWVYDNKKGAFYKYVIDFSQMSAENMVVDWDNRTVITREGRPYRFIGGATSGTYAFKDVIDLTNAGAYTYQDYSSYAIISNKNALLDPDKQIEAVHCTFENSNYGTYPSNTDGACKLSVIYDNHAGPSTSRTSPEQDAYRHVPGRVPNYTTGNVYRTVQTRLKVRGHGKHFRIKLRSVGSQNFKLVGYALDVSYPSTELRRISMGGGGGE